MKQFEKVFTNLWIKLEQTEEGSPPNKTDELAKSTSWADIMSSFIKFWRPGEKSWMKTLSIRQTSLVLWMSP